MSIEAVLHIRELIKETLREAFSQADYREAQRLRRYFRKVAEENSIGKRKRKAQQIKFEFEVPVDFIKFIEAFFMKQFKLNYVPEMGEQLQEKFAEMKKEHADELKELLRIALHEYLLKKRKRILDTF